MRVVLLAGEFLENCYLLKILQSAEKKETRAARTVDLDGFKLGDYFFSGKLRPEG